MTKTQSPLMLLAAVLMLSSLVGCKIDPLGGSTEFTGIGSPFAFSGANNATIQSHNDNAQEALESISHLNGDASKEYRQAAEIAAAKSQAAADQAQQFFDESQELLALNNEVANFTGRMELKLEEAWADVEHLADNLFGVGRNEISDHETIGDLVPKLKDAADAVIFFSTALISIANEVKTFVTENAEALGPFSQDLYVLGFEPNPASLDQVTDAFVAEANAYRETATRLNNTEFDIHDPNVRYGDADNSDLSIFVRDINLLTRGGTESYDEPKALTVAGQAFGALNSVTYNIVEKQNELGTSIAALRENAVEHSAEAVRNSWLALEAEGEPIPPEIQAMIEDPFDGQNQVPAWNSTFWDVSSP